MLSTLKPKLDYWFVIHYYSRPATGRPMDALLDAQPLLHPADEVVDLLGRVEVLGDAGALGAALGPGGQPRALLLHADAAEAVVGEEPRREGHERDVDEAEGVGSTQPAIS